MTLTTTAPSYSYRAGGSPALQQPKPSPRMSRAAHHPAFCVAAAAIRVVWLPLLDTTERLLPFGVRA